jgi:hypothetical protein
VNRKIQVKLSHEHKDFCWAPLPRAIELVGYDLSMKEFLETAEKYLTQKDLALAIEQLSPF